MRGPARRERDGAMAVHFWYILIHVGLGLVGFRIFTFTNIGGLYAFLAASVVQGYAIWEIHKLARPRFEASLPAGIGHMERREKEREYNVRLARAWFFRCCIYALLTLFVAWVVRGGK
jgi:hypothetical protein